MSRRTDALAKRLDKLQADMDTIEDAAEADGRDLTDDEKTAHADLVNRAATVNEEIEQATAFERTMLEAHATLAKVNGGGATVDRAAPVQDAPELTVGEFLAAFYTGYHPEHQSTPDEFINRAARYIDRAQQATADTAGIIPAPILGPVIKLADSRRPVFNSLTARTMPAKGKTFERPRITQRTTAGTQTEGQTLDSQKMTIASETVTKATQGGFLDLTQQDIDWTEPSALELLIQDFVDTYAEWTEGLACDFVESMPVAADAANNGDGYSAWDDTDVGTIVTSVVGGIQDVYTRSKRTADTLWLDFASWAALAAKTNDNDDVTALEMIRRAVGDLQSQMGGMGGFRFVVGPEFAANTRIVGSSGLGERYEQQNGLLRALQPSTLSVQLAYSGYTAFYGRYEAFCQLGDDPSPS